MPAPPFGEANAPNSGLAARQPIEVTMNEQVQTATSAPLFDPLAPELIRDPYPHYERLRTEQIVDETPDAIAAQGHMDLIEDFAFRLPVTIICDMLGIPEDHREVFYKSSRDGGRLLDPVPLSRAEIEQANASNAMARMYFQQLFELRRRSPGDDLTTQLVQAEDDGSKLSNEELTANIILLFGAGHETTVNLIGNGLFALHRHPDQLALLNANPARITNALED